MNFKKKIRKTILNSYKILCKNQPFKRKKIQNAFLKYEAKETSTILTYL